MDIWNFKLNLTGQILVCSLILAISFFEVGMLQGGKWFKYFVLPGVYGLQAIGFVLFVWLIVENFPNMHMVTTLFMALVAYSGLVYVTHFFLKEYYQTYLVSGRQQPSETEKQAK
jgi:O-antigen/teichoic acid export membrane protein